MLSVKGPDAVEGHEASPAHAMQHQDQDRGQEGFGFHVTEETKAQCELSVVSTLPDIDPEYLTRICTEVQWDANHAIDRILDQMENGKPYPRVPKPNLLKRKRDDEEDEYGLEKTAAKFDNVERRQQLKAASYKKTCDMIMQQSFPEFYAEDLRRTFVKHGNCLYPAFLEVTATIAGSNNRPPYRKKSRVTQIPRRYDLDALADRIREINDQGEREALEEFQALRGIQARQHAESEAEREREEAEKTNLETAMLEGNIADCGCCFVENALNRMVHCDGEILHWFCRDCARQMAETQIGLSKYRLDCMSTDGCTGSFAMDQKEIFLDALSMTALDRIEQEAVLREAGIENLETCPHCPFAAEYPPIEEDKEFRCLNPDCAITSCRSCRKETHLPRTCVEVALDNGHSARHEIEEAMSAALIRTCNKCSAPFIKENGCNKMACTKCRNIQCYVCSKSCDYTHFNDASRGGKTGNCPLFDDGYGVEKRHQEEVRAAEEQARKRAREMHPEIQADLLEFKVSDEVKKDEENKATAQQHFHHRHHLHQFRAGGRLGLGRLVEQWEHGFGHMFDLAALGQAQLEPQPQAQPQAQPQPQPQPRPRPPLPPAAAVPHQHRPFQLPPAVNVPAPPHAHRLPAAFVAPLHSPHDRAHVQAQPPADGSRPPIHPSGHILRRRYSGQQGAQVAVAPATPPCPVVEHPNPLPQDHLAEPVLQAPPAPAQPYVDPQAVFGQPPGRFWNLMGGIQEMDGMNQAILPWNISGLHDQYGQSEHPRASPVGNGLDEVANEMNHRSRDPAREEPAMNDGSDLLHLAAPHEGFGNLAMDVGPVGHHFDDFDDLAYAQYPNMDGFDGIGLDLGPHPFGFDDFVFR